MEKTDIIVYGLSGLGVDSRIFKGLKLNNKLVVLEWISPELNESIDHYAKRLSHKIDASKPFILLGVSFGGLMAIEIAKILTPKALILVSSVQNTGELRPIYRWFGRIQIMKRIPKWVLKPPIWVFQIILGTSNRAMIREIRNDIDTDFIHYGVSKLLEWKHYNKMDNCIKINGTKDLLMPLRRSANTKVIKGGTHFMIVDKVEEVSLVIHQSIATFQ